MATIPESTIPESVEKIWAKRAPRHIFTFLGLQEFSHQRPENFGGEIKFQVKLSPPDADPATAVFVTNIRLFQDKDFPDLEISEKPDSATCVCFVLAQHQRNHILVNLYAGREPWEPMIAGKLNMFIAQRMYEKSVQLRPDPSRPPTRQPGEKTVPQQ
jgi:hypothetical protein